MTAKWKAKKQNLDSSLLLKRKSTKPTKELTDTKKTTRIRKRFGPFKVAFRTGSRTWIECLVVGNIFQ